MPTPPPTSRLLSPCAYSWMTISWSKSPSMSGVGASKTYICMRPGEPSAGVEKFALFVPEPSCASASTASLPSPPRPKLFVWKLPAASVKPSW